MGTQGIRIGGQSAPRETDQNELSSLLKYLNSAQKGGLPPAPEAVLAKLQIIERKLNRSGAKIDAGTAAQLKKAIGNEGRINKAEFGRIVGGLISQVEPQVNPEPAAEEIRSGGLPSIGRILGGGETGREEQEASGKSAEEENRRKAQALATEVRQRADALVNFSDWDNIKAFVDNAEKIRGNLNELKVTYPRYVNDDTTLKEGKTEIGLLESINKSIELLFSVGLITKENMDEWRAGRLDYAKMGTEVEDFAKGVARAVLNINTVEMGLRDYVFGVLPPENALNKGDIKSIVNSMGGSGYYEFALQALFGDLSKFKFGSRGGGAVTCEFDLPKRSDATNVMQYQSWARLVLDNPEGMRGEYARAQAANPQAAETLVYGHARDLQTGDVVVRDAAVLPPEGILAGYDSYRAKRPAYDTLSMLMGFILLESRLPFAGIQAEGSADLQIAINSFISFNQNFAQMRDLLDSALRNPQMDFETEFRVQFETAYNSALSHIALLEQSSGQGQELLQALHLMRQGLDLFSSAGTVDSAKAWEYAKSANPAEMDELSQSLLNIQSGVQTIENLLYGANPARALFERGATLQRGAMLQFLSQGESVRNEKGGFERSEWYAEKILKGIYPDRSFVDLSTRNQIAGEILNYVEAVYSNRPMSDRYTMLSSFLKELAHTDFYTTNLASGLVSDMFGISPQGSIFIKGRVLGGVQNVYAPRGLNIYEILRAQMYRTQFGPFGYIPTVHAIGATYLSDVPRTVDAAVASQQLFKKRKLTKLDYFPPLYMQSLARGYHADYSMAIAKVSQAYDSVMVDRSAVPGLFSSDRLSARGSLGSTQRSTKNKGGAIQAAGAQGTSSRWDVGGSLNQIEMDHNRHQSQLRAIGNVANYRLFGGGIINTLFADIGRTETTQGDVIPGFDFEVVSQTTLARLNASPYRNSRIIAHYDERASERTAPSETAGGAQVTETQRITRQASLYYHLGGETWVRMIPVDDISRQKVRTIEDMFEQETGKIEETHNRLEAGGTVAGSLQVTGAYQQRWGVREGVETKPGDIAELRRGFIVGVGYDDLKSAIAGAQTVDAEKAAAATHVERAWETTMSYYELRSAGLAGRVTDGSFGVSGSNIAGVFLGSRDLSGSERTNIGAGEVAIGTEDIFRASLAASLGKDIGKEFLGATFGHQTADYTRGEGGSLQTAFGFFNWDKDGKLKAARYGTTGDFREIDTSYLAQINRVGGRYTRYTGAVRTEAGEDFTLEVVGNLADPPQFYSSIRRSLLDNEVLRTAYDNYNNVARNPDSTMEQKNSALNQVGQAMNSVFQRADGFSLFDQLGSSINDITISGGGEHGAFVWTYSNQMDPVLGKKVNMASLVDTGKNLALIATFDVKDGKMVAGGGGAIAKVGDDFKTLFLVTSVPKGVSPREYEAEGALAHGVHGIDVVSTGDLFRIEYTNVNGTVPFLVSYVNMEPGFEQVGGKTVWWRNDRFTEVLELGTGFYKEARKYNVGLEHRWIGTMFERLGMAGTLGAGIRYEMDYAPGTKAHNWVAYFDFKAGW